MITKYTRFTGLIVCAAAALLFLGYGYPCFQEKKDVKDAKVVFPESWKGVWKGKCKSTNPKNGGYEFAMELHILDIEKPDRMAWKLIYGESDRGQVRDYEIVTVNQSENHYQIDEKNSIALDSYFAGNIFSTQYSVGGALLTVTYKKDGDAIIFNIISSEMDKPVSSGGKDGVPKVLAYPINAIQNARLLKQ